MRKNTSEVINIIYPSTLNQALADDLVLCEVFIDAILKSDKTKVYLEVNHKESVVESNDQIVKAALSLILKTQKIDAFYNQFLGLLHSAGSGFLGTLKLLSHNKIINIKIHEKK